MPVSSPRRLVSVLAAVAVLAGCSSSGDTDEADIPMRTVSTDQGDVEIPADPKRIVVLNSALTGYFYALDVKVHGSLAFNPGDTEFPAYWAAEAKDDGTVNVPWSSDGLDFEAVLDEDPDLIIGGGQGFPGVLTTEAYDDLTDIAPTVLVSNTLTSWQEELDYIADEILDIPEANDALQTGYADRVAEVKENITVPQGQASYMMMLADLSPWGVPETSALPSAIAELGIEPAPIVADHPEFELFGTGDSFEVSTEQVGEVFDSPTVFVFGFQEDVTTIDELAENPVYAALPAFAADQAYVLPYWAYRADYYNSMALLDYLEELFG